MSTNSVATRVLFGRVGTNGAKLFFSLAVGITTPDGPVYSTIIRDLVLRDSTNGKGPYVAFPSKPRLQKIPNTNPQQYVQVVKDGKNQYDSLVDLYFEGSGEDRKPTEAAWDFRKQVIEQAEAAYAKLANGETGRGAAAASAAPADVQRTTGGGSKRPSMFAPADDSTEEIPF